MQHRLRTTRRRTASVVVTAALAALVGTTVSVVPTPAPASAATREVESPDFASQVHGDPWDYSNVEDQNTDEVNNSSSLRDGKLRVHLVGDTAVSLVSTTSGSLPYGRDGGSRSVNASTYRSLSFSMDQPFSKQIGAVYWWTCREKTSACGGGTTFEVTAGSHVYDLALSKASTLQARKPWSGKIVSVRLDPVVLPTGKSGTASIDWVRLHGSGGAKAAYPPGTHGSTVVVPRPRPVVDSPNPDQGEDLATTQRGRPWDFTSPAAMQGATLRNATITGYGSSGMTARNSGSAKGDSQLLLPVSRFSASKYHRLSIDYTYDGRYSLAGTPGGGKMARLIWWDATSSVPQIGNDVLTYSGRNARRISIDLNKQDDLDEDALAPRLGWSKRTVSSLRFDPNEDPGALTWHLKALHLRADPSAVGKTTVRFHDAAWVSGTTATVSVARTAPTATWHAIARDVPVTKGSNSVVFSVADRPASSYRIRVTLTHPGVPSATAEAPSNIVMHH